MGAGAGRRPGAGVTHHGAFSTVALGAVAAGLVAYLVGVRAGRPPPARGRAAGRRWPVRRTVAFVAGALAVGAALAPPVMHAAHGDLRVHMVQHVVVGMLAPVGLVLGAPVTVALRALPVRAARRVARVLRSAPVRVVSHPAVALALNVGGMAALYATPLYAAMQGSAVLHAAVHVHVLAAGCLFTWAVLAGPDPAPHAAGMGVRLGVLCAAIAAHAVLAKLMFARLWPAGVAGAAETQAAAQVMYYGGDLAEALLLAVLLAAWYRGDRRQTLGRWLPATAGGRA